MTHRLFANRSLVVSSLILFVASLACTQIPLLNYLGFEFSILIVIIAGYCSGLMSIGEWKSHPPQTISFFWVLIRRAIVRSAYLIVIPLVIISLNGLFVKNCSYTQGFRLYILYVAPGVLFCISLAILSSSISKKFTRSLFTLMFLLTVLHVAYVTLTGPQIFAFNPIVGYFPGLSYDETFQGELRLLTYRVGTLALSWLILSAAAILLTVRWRKRNVANEQHSFLRYAPPIIVCLTVYIGLAFLSNKIGLSSSAEFIADQLGGSQKTPHFLIIYPKQSVSPDQLRSIALLHEYLFDELRKEFGVDPRRRITTFLYASPKQKERLIGAGRTDFTKPWLRQVHVNLEDVDDVLKHELTHAMLAEHGIPFLEVAPNSGLIEGAAVAAERMEYDEPLHQLAAEILALGTKPKVAEMFTVGGFFKSYAGVSYVLAGSFCRYLMDRYGVDRFKALYRSGAFESEYHKDLHTLLAEWQRTIQLKTVSRENLMKASYLFRRPPFFAKECVRVIANLNAQSRDYLAHKDYAQALESASFSFAQSRSIDAVYLKTAALFGLKLYAVAIDFVEHQLSDTSVNYALLPLRLILGDCYWAVEEYTKANTEYSTVLSTDISLPLNESAAIRLSALSNTGSRTALTRYFTESMTDSERVQYLNSLSDSNSSADLVGYLLGREFARKNNNSAVIGALVPLGDLNSPNLAYIKNQRIARAYFNLGNYERAKVYYWEALNYVPNDAHLLQVMEMLQRCTWIQSRTR